MSKYFSPSKVLYFSQLTMLSILPNIATAEILSSSTLLAPLSNATMVIAPSPAPVPAAPAVIPTPETPVDNGACLYGADVPIPQTNDDVYYKYKGNSCAPNYYCKETVAVWGPRLFNQPLFVTRPCEYFLATDKPLPNTNPIDGGEAKCASDQVATRAIVDCKFKVVKKQELTRPYCYVDSIKDPISGNYRIELVIGAQCALPVIALDLPQSFCPILEGKEVNYGNGNYFTPDPNPEMTYPSNAPVDACNRKAEKIWNYYANRGEGASSYSNVLILDNDVSPLVLQNMVSTYKAAYCEGKTLEEFTQTYPSVAAMAKNCADKYSDTVNFESWSFQVCIAPPRWYKPVIPATSKTGEYPGETTK